MQEYLNIILEAKTALEDCEKSGEFKKWRRELIEARKNNKSERFEGNYV